MRFQLQFLIVVGIAWVAPFATGVAQRVTGVVHETSSSRALPGAVVFLVDSGGRALARTITDTAGRYWLTWLPATSRLRVVRMGFRPANERTLSGLPRDTSINVELDRLPAMLTAVRVTSDAVCADSPDRREALELWEQARAGLLATIVAREAAAGRMTNLTYERRLDPASRRVTRISAHITTGATNRPFRSARSGPELVRLGYMETRGADAVVFFAPDADILLEESFASAHCFSVRRGDESHQGLVGLAFEPRGERRRETFVDVSGVLWLNPVGPALSDLEFRYTGVHPLVARAGAGGALRFQTMSNGVAFVAEWTMTLPALLPGPSPRSPPSLVAIGETGGMVLDATWPDGAKWSADISPLSGRATERGSRAAIAGAIVTIDGLSDTVTSGRDGRFTMPPLPAGLYSLHITDMRLADFIRPRTVGKDVRISRGVAADGSLELPSQSALVAELCRDQRTRERGGGETATLLGRVTDGDSAVTGDLVLETTWQADYTIARDAPGVTIDEARRTIDLDAGGTFVVCRAASDRPIRMRLRLGRVLVADTVVTLRGTSFYAVHWALRGGILAAARRGDASSLVGRVVNENTGAPIAGADVWLMLDDARVTTDSSGRFALHGVSARRHIVQVRRIGFAMRRDTTTLLPGVETERQFRLTSQAVTLDTVRAVAAGVRYISPALRGFEERRATGQGHFLAEDELRKNDNRTLANVLRRIPAVSIMPYRSADYVASRRGQGSVTTLLPRADPSDPKSPRACWVAIYLDGIPVYTGPPQPPPDFARMQVHDFAAVEFYAGGATVPVQFNATKALDCGVMLLWTREH